MRDRLIELLTNLANKEGAMIEGLELWADSIADHLLAEGVLVLPCKVGDKVYTIDTYNMEVVKWSFGLQMIDRIGKTVFLTREEAERALERSE